MEFSISLALGGWAVLIAGAVIIGVGAQMIGEAEFGYEWVITAFGAGLGALVASQFVVEWRAFEPVWDNLALLPALAGGLIAGALVAVTTRLATGGSVLGRPAA